MTNILNYLPLNTLNSNSIKWKGNVVNSINYPNNTTNEVWINYVALEQNDIVNIKGFPGYAYGYGVLITVFSGQAFRNIQLYIPHSDGKASNRPIYFRTLADGNSDKGDGTSWRVAQVTTIEAY